MIIIKNCGYDSRHKTKFTMFRQNGISTYILLLVKTEAFFEVNGEIIRTKPNMCILFDRNAKTHYGSVNNFYNDDWVHFDFLEETSLLDQLKIPFNTPITLPHMSHLSNYIRLIVQEHLSETKHCLKIQDGLIRSLLYSLDAQVQMLPSLTLNHKYYSIMNQLRTHIYNTPQKKWTVASMSDYVHLSPSYFQHLYKEFFHLSCVSDVIRARLELAKFYLSTSDISIQMLAEFCGYENALHFMRQFKKQEGVTPTQYRTYHFSERKGGRPTS